MGKLAHIPMGPPSLEGMVKDVVDNIVSQTQRGLQPDFAQQINYINAVIETMGGIAPAVQRAMVAEIKPILAELRKKKPDNSKALHDRLVNALSNIRIPDNTEQLNRIEAQQPDLYPVIKAVKDLKFPEPDVYPRVWDFEIIRNDDGLIERVIATAED